MCVPVVANWVAFLWFFRGYVFFTVFLTSFTPILYCPTLFSISKFWSFDFGAGIMVFPFRHRTFIFVSCTFIVFLTHSILCGCVVFCLTFLTHCISLWCYCMISFWVRGTFFWARYRMFIWAVYELGSFPLTRLIPIISTEGHLLCLLVCTKMVLLPNIHFYRKYRLNFRTPSSLLVNIGVVWLRRTFLNHGQLSTLRLLARCPLVKSVNPQLASTT